MILNDNSTQQINTALIQLQNKLAYLDNNFTAKNTELLNKINALDKRITALENK